MSEIRIGLIGAGNIAKKHLEVIKNIKSMTAVGITSRTRSKAEEMAREFNINRICDNSAELVDKCNLHALLLLVSSDQMFSVTKNAIKFKLPFFMEKPPGLSPNETKILSGLVKDQNIPNMVGYNRRYYSIFHKGLDIIKKHGKLLGIRVEGHERFWRIANRVNETVRTHWIYANSTHTIDLLRFFGGEPSIVKSLSRSHIEKNGDQFAAIMEFESGAIGHYISHWYSPGGWSVRLFGEGVSVDYRPLESGKWIDNEFNEWEITPDDIDQNFKPGFYKQMEAFERMIRKGKLEWPGQDISASLKTMKIAENITQCLT
jgi:predicted dehydrogenase